MKQADIIQQLSECENWIVSVAGKTESKRPHIKKMLKGLEEATKIVAKTK